VELGIGDGSVRGQQQQVGIRPCHDMMGTTSPQAVKHQEWQPGVHAPAVHTTAVHTPVCGPSLVLPGTAKTSAPLTSRLSCRRCWSLHAAPPRGCACAGLPARLQCGARRERARGEKSVDPMKGPNRAKAATPKAPTAQGAEGTRPAGQQASGAQLLQEQCLAAACWPVLACARYPLPRVHHTLSCVRCPLPRQGSLLAAHPRSARAGRRRMPARSCRTAPTRGWS